ncbi:MAG: hypothetical protein ABI678_30580 [Kofleriaceae bacterium]
MTLDRWDRQAIAASLSANGFLRRSPWRNGGRAGHREWLHFTVHAPALQLVLNASIVDDLRPAAEPHRERARVVVLARDPDGWQGGVVEHAEAEVRGGQLAATFGDLQITGDGGTITIRGAVAGIELDLALEAVTFPSVATGVALGAGPPINWLVVPRLVVTGRAVVGGRTIDLTGATAYHDHNWGFFSHRDFTWQWGHDAGAGPHSVVLARLLDGAQATTYMQAMLVWRDARQARVFRGSDLQIEPQGFLRPARPFTVPRSAALLVDHVATEIPQRLHITAAGDGDTLTGTFEAASVARIVVPHDDTLETTVIHEVDGRLHLTGMLHDRPIAVDAPAMFEFLRSVG